MKTSSSDHIRGVLRLIDPNEKERAKRQLGDARSREKWLKRLAHNIFMHPDFAKEPPRGERTPEKILARLRALGAGDDIYLIASDSNLDGSIQALDEMIKNAGDLFDHGTIISCVPGKLAFFRTAYPHKHYIVYRPD